MTQPKPDLYSAFLNGELAPEDLAEQAHINFQNQNPSYGAHLPIYTIRERIADQMRIPIEQAVLCDHLGETGVMGFSKAPCGVVVPVQSCRNMYLSAVWATFSESCDDASNLLWQAYGGRNPRYPIHVPEGWDFLRLRKMLQSFNFHHFRRSDPDFDYGQDAEVFCRLKEPDWMQGVRPLG